MVARVIIGFVVSLCTVAFSGCGGRLYSVAPLPAGAPATSPTNDADGLNVNASALDGDQSLERFDANLPLAGVIAIEVRLANRTSTAINVAPLKFELRGAGSKPFKMITPKNALKRVMQFYGNALYRIDARQRTIESYEATALPLDSTIAPQEEHRGFLFFEAPRNTTRLDGLTLSAVGAKPPINIKIN